MKLVFIYQIHRALDRLEVVSSYQANEEDGHSEDEFAQSEVVLDGVGVLVYECWVEHIHEEILESQIVRIGRRILSDSFFLL